MDELPELRFVGSEHPDFDRYTQLYSFIPFFDIGIVFPHSLFNKQRRSEITELLYCQYIHIIN